MPRSEQQQPHRPGNRGVENRAERVENNAELAERQRQQEHEQDHQDDARPFQSSPKFGEAERQQSHYNPPAVERRNRDQVEQSQNQIVDDERYQERTQE